MHIRNLHYPKPALIFLTGLMCASTAPLQAQPLPDAGALQQQIENSQLSSIDPFSNSNSSVRLEKLDEVRLRKL